MISWISAVELGAVIVAIILGVLHAVNRICASLNKLIDGIGEVRSELGSLRDRMDSIEGTVRDLHGKHNELIVYLKNGVKK